MKKINAVFLMFFLFFLPLFNVFAQRAPLEVNLIIDGSSALEDVKDEITSWLIEHFDHILSEGDRVNIWSAGTTAAVVYSGSISTEQDKEAVKRTIRELSISQDCEPGNADFSGALLAASRRQTSVICYTLLVSASPAALSSVLSGPQADLLRFSRVEEFPGWRTVVVGLNINSRVRNAAARYIES